VEKPKNPADPVESSLGQAGFTRLPEEDARDYPAPLDELKWRAATEAAKAAIGSAVTPEAAAEAAARAIQLYVEMVGADEDRRDPGG